MQSTIGDGQRSSGATAYLNPVQDRCNLDILINSRATKLIDVNPVTLRAARQANFGSDAFGQALPDLRKVELAQTSQGMSYLVYVVTVLFNHDLQVLVLTSLRVGR